MKKLVFAIFAHPDDEAFGPCATLCRAVEDGAELHLICVTDGAAGEHTPGQSASTTRRKEWEAVGELIGARYLHPLGYGDGTLSNSLYHEIAERIERIIRQSCDQPSEVSLITFDTNGLTGHLDHIAVSYITTYVFYELKKSPPRGSKVTELAYYCLSAEQAPTPDLKYFVHMPAGRGHLYINRQVDAHDMVDKKRQIISLHHSQATDVANALARDDAELAIENFHVIR